MSEPKTPSAADRDAPPENESLDHSEALSVLEQPIQQQLHDELERIIPAGLKQNGQILEKVNQVVLGIMRREVFHGPLPHPRHLEAYERITPGAADRIIKTAETEQSHRHAWEDRSLFFDFLYAYTGLVLGFIVAILLMIGAYVSETGGHDAVALAFLAASAIGMVGSFVKGRELFPGRKAEPAKFDEKPALPAPRKKQTSAPASRKRTRKTSEP